jgi:hypothetical protein
MSQPLGPFLLWISVPLCIVLAITGCGTFWTAVYSYAQEKPVSVAGGVASDIVDLFLVLPILVLSTIFARRGSVRAALIWTGTLGFLSYNFMIYAFDVHFNPMFLAYCAVLGLSFYGLITALGYLSPDEVAKTFSPRAPRIPIAVVFLFIAVSAASREVMEIVAAIRSGQKPPGILETGQFTDPIHVLDLCFLLPALVIAAVLLLRRREKGFVLAPVLSVVLILISVEVVTIILVMIKKGLTTDYRPAVSFGAAGAVVTALLIWYFRPQRNRLC